jgi:hypothetical protein
MVLARPTILGQSQSGLRPKVAPGNFRKSSASETVLVSSKDKRSSALSWFMSEVLINAPIIKMKDSYVNLFISIFVIQIQYQKTQSKPHPVQGAS